MKSYLPEQTRISQVHLRIGRLETALAFYADVLGLKVRYRSGPHALLSAAGEGLPSLALTEDPSAPPRPPRSIGLYHFAIRYPTRQDLAQACYRLAKSEYRVEGASDHGVSEAIYLNDPDGNGVELYADRSRAQWPRRNGQVDMATKPLNLDELLDAAASESDSAGPPPQTDIGHIHLHVPDLAAAERFYGEFLGLAVTQRSYPGALFFAAGDYHHHIGANVWAGKTIPPANSLGLIAYRLEVSCPEILYCLGHRAPLQGYATRSGPEEEGGAILQMREPSGAWLEIQVSPSTTAAPVPR